MTQFTAKDPLATTALDEFLFDVTGTDEAGFFGLARIEPDPWLFVEEVELELRMDETVPDDERAGFELACKKFKDNLDLARSIQEHDSASELEYTPQWDTRYSSKQFWADVRGDEQVNFAIEGAVLESRKAWKRTHGDDPSMRIITEIGNFSMDATKKNADSMLRVRRTTRKGVPFLSIGSVQVNMHTGVCACWVSGCNWRRQLRYCDETTKLDPTKLDREFAEFQVLSILQHLGDHTRKNPQNYWDIILHVSRTRDDKDALRSSLGILELFEEPELEWEDLQDRIDERRLYEARVNGLM